MDENNLTNVAPEEAVETVEAVAEEVAKKFDGESFGAGVLIGVLATATGMVLGKFVVKPIARGIANKFMGVKADRKSASESRTETEQ